MKMKQCPKCQGSEIVVGSLMSAGKVDYKTDDKSIFNVGKLNAYTCKECGYTELYADLEYLKK